MFYRPDALPDSNQQIHSGLHLFGIHHDSLQEGAPPLLCPLSNTSAPRGLHIQARLMFNWRILGVNMYDALVAVCGVHCPSLIDCDMV